MTVHDLVIVKTGMDASIQMGSLNGDIQCLIC